MLPSRDRLAYLRPAGTCLTCAAWIDFHQNAGGAFSLLRDLIDEASPSGIINRLAKPAASQSLNVQIFNSDQAVGVYNLARFLVMKVSALIADVIMPTLKNQHGLTSPIRSLLTSRNTPLQSPQFCLCVSKKARIFNNTTIAQGCERTQPNVYADHAGSEWERLHVTLNSEDRKPAPRLALNRERLNRSINWPMQFYANPADLRQPQLIPSESMSDLPKNDAVVSTRRTESRIAWFLAAFNAPEKRLERKVDVLKGAFKHLGVYRCYVFSDLLNVRELDGLVKERDRLTFTQPCVTSLLNRCVVKLTAQRKSLIQCLDLLYGRINPVFV